MLHSNNNPPRFFPSVGLKLTGQCRLRCPFCCEPDRNQKTYPVESFFELTNILSENGTRRLCLTGGEPLLYPDLPKLLNHTKKLGFFNLLLTSDGSLLKQKYQELLPNVDAVRFSIHGVGSKHDEIVGETNAFSEIDEMIGTLTDLNVPCYVTTVVSNLNSYDIHHVADWCFSKKIKQYYIFGLMKSGRGMNFIDTKGEVPEQRISEIMSTLNEKYADSAMRIVHYDYRNKSECILVYGDGRVVIDPYPVEPVYQYEIGNLLSDSIADIKRNFKTDPDNIKGYAAHYDMTPSVE